MGQPPQRRRIGPLHIVDHHHQRTLGRQVGRQPEQPVQRRVGSVVLHARDLAAVEHPRRQTRRTVEQLRPLALRRSETHRLEQLAHHTERKVALERKPPCHHDSEVAVARQLTRRPQQARLPDPRRALDQHYRPASLDSAGYRAGDHGQLRVAFQQQLAAPQPYALDD